MEKYYNEAVKQGFKNEVQNTYEQAQLAAINKEAYEGLDLEEVS
jgi:hypothetical protein